jgi:hypothetical protein
MDMERREQITDYDRTEPIVLMLSPCDLDIIEGARGEVEMHDFLQRMISENLRCIRDRGGK